jgi:hypothetical protein
LGQSADPGGDAWSAAASAQHAAPKNGLQNLAK